MFLLCIPSISSRRTRFGLPSKLAKAMLSPMALERSASTLSCSGYVTNTNMHHTRNSYPIHSGLLCFGNAPDVNGATACYLSFTCTPTFLYRNPPRGPCWRLNEALVHDLNVSPNASSSSHPQTCLWRLLSVSTNKTISITASLSPPSPRPRLRVRTSARKSRAGRL